MNDYEIVTVATHSFGKFNELINNPYKKIKVLGMGQKWTGYKMKSQLVYDYIKNMDDNKMIIFLDGFDSEINDNPDKSIQIFKSNNYKLLFSKSYGNTILSNFFINQVFTHCINKTVSNPGMYMGYVKYLKIFYENSLKNKCKDDMVVSNLLCKDLNFINVDSENKIFENKYIQDKDIKSNAIFISYPGTFSFFRISRAFFEYGQFFLKYILILYILLFLLLFYIKYYKSLLIVSILLIFYLFNIDYSCTDFNFL